MYLKVNRTYPIGFLWVLAVVILSGCQSVSRVDLAREYFSIAQDYFAEKNYARALEYFQQAETYFPDRNRDVSYNIAVIELIEGNLSQAEEIIVTLKEADPDNLLVQELEALLFYQKGYYLAALKTFVSLRNKGMTDVRIIQNMALIYTDLQDNVAFVESVQENEALNEEEYLVGLADAHAKLGNLDEATILYKEYMQIVQDDEQKLLIAADFFYEIGDYSELLAVYDDLLELGGENAEYLFEKAYIQIVNGIAYEEGINHLERALQLGYDAVERLKALLDAELFDPESVRRVYRTFNVEIPSE